MLEAVKFDGVSAAELMEDVSFSVPAGSLAALITSRQEESDLLLRLMLGLDKPSKGSVNVLDQEVGKLSEKALYALRRGVAAVPPTGGLVSNLKVWENLVLPLEYFALYSPSEIEERGLAALRRVGYTGRHMELPAHLSLYQRRQIGLARAMLAEPRLIVYNGILDGVSGGEKSSLISVITGFHRDNSGRTSLLLTPNEESTRGIAPDSRIVIKDRGTGPL